MPDLPSNPSTSAILTVGGSITNTIDTIGDTDWIRIDLAPGEWVEVTQSGTGGSALPDSYLSIYDAYGFLITNDDDTSTSLNAQVLFGGGDGGTYYIAAEAATSRTGDYTVTARAVAAPAGSPVDALNSGVGRNDPDDVVTVYFVPNGEGANETYDNIDSVISEGWDPTEIDRFMAALTSIEAVIDINFVQSTEPDSDFQLVLNSSDFPGPGFLGYFYGPSDFDSVGVFNPDGFGWDADGLQEGGLGFATIVHEVLHGLGLDHPFEGPDAIPGVDYEFFEYGANGLNQGIYTTMSYNSGNADAPPVGDYGGEAGPMALDIAALQQLYGANTTHASGGNTYALPDTNAVGTAWQAIWDTGGVDQIVYAGTRDVVIDLRAATLGYGIGAGGYLSNADGIIGGYTIANGVVIENATGGSGNDRLIGNNVSNVLTGNNGNDTLIGDQGADQLNGGAGADTLLGGADDDTISGGTGNDTAIGGTGRDTIGGGSNDDTLSGNSGGDTISSESGTNTINGNSGDDTLTGGTGIDTINGGGGDDTINGGLGNDILTGGRGSDTINGGGDADRIDGGWGSDTLTGGAGNDIFHFAFASDSMAGAGLRDVITDFDQSGDDRIDLTAIDANRTTASNDAFTFIGADAFTAAGQVRIELAGSDSIVQMDRDGDGIADMEIFLTGTAVVDTGDFIL